MPNLKTAIPLVLLWGATLAGSFWLGRESVPVADGGSPPVAAPAIEPVPAAPAEPRAPQDLSEARDVLVRSADTVVAAAADQLRGGLMSQRRVLTAFGLMQELDADSVLEAVAEVESLGDGRSDRDVLLLAVLGRWAELDGTSAMRYAEERLEGELRTGVVTNVATAWAEADPEAALAWYRARHASGELEQDLGSVGIQLLAPIFQGLANFDPEGALSELGGLESHAEFRMALAGMVSAMSAAGKSQQLLAHIGRLPQGAQAEARQIVVGEWARFSPGEAAAWVGRQSESSQRAKLAKEVGLEWVRRDPRRAITWLMEHTPPEQHPAHLAACTSTWARTDPNAAAQWLGALQAGPVVDPAIAAFARQIVSRDPVSAFAWAGTVGQPVMREQALESVFAQWAIREPAGALAHLEDAELPEGLEKKLRQFVPAEFREKSSP